MGGDGETHSPAIRIAVVGGGLSGTLLALKLSKARPDLDVVLIDEHRIAGRGLAYGAASPHHLLNVPVSRMETGLEPRFADWLGQRPGEVADALVESRGHLADAFVQRTLFGLYLAERLTDGRKNGPGLGLHVLRGRAVSALSAGRRGVVLEDGRIVEAAKVVLATGNLPPSPPGRTDAWFYDTPLFTSDPWAPDAFVDLKPDQPVLLVGTGLTMVDVALTLAGQGHTGPMLAFSRRGLSPKAHQAGGAWPAFLTPHLDQSPIELLRLVRIEVKKAEANGTPWQRVFDAARPAIAVIWSRWSLKQRRQFLRHLRARWDIHRHRTAPRINQAFQALQDKGQLRIQAARLAGFELDGERVKVKLKPRGGGESCVSVARVINCTGPASALDQLALPLIESLRAQGAVKPDALGLGLESDDCALIEGSGAASDWLFALGPLTRPAWWEITATPEIGVQGPRPVARLAASDASSISADAASAFLDLGAGI